MFQPSRSLRQIDL